MDVQAIIQSYQAEKRAIQRRYAHAAERRWELRTRAVSPKKADIKRKILLRYDLETKMMNERINDLGEAIWRLQTKMKESK